MFLSHKGWVFKYQVAWKGLLMNSHNLWWKGSRVYYRKGSFGQQPHMCLHFNNHSHSKDLLYGNKEWITTSSSEYTTCLAVMKQGAIIQKVRKPLSRNNLESLKCRGRQDMILFMWSPLKTKAAFIVKYDTHLAPVDNGVPVLAVVIHHIDVIQVGVCPVHQLLDQVQCQSSGLLNFIIHQKGPVGAVHVAALHLGHVPIVREEEHSAESGSVDIIKCRKRRLSEE